MSEVTIDNHTPLFRITSVAYCDEDQLLNGAGGTNSRGRFHNFQPASYVASSWIVSICEIAFHKHRRLLSLISERASFEEISAALKFEGVLAAFRLQDEQVVFDAESEASRYDIDQRISGTALITPGMLYEPLHDYANTIRQKGLPGVKYPSARCARDRAFVFFGDKTSALDPSTLIKMPLSIHLLSEDQANDDGKPDFPKNPFETCISSTTAYFEFLDKDKLSEAIDKKYFGDSPPLPAGYFHFVRGMNALP